LLVAPDASPSRPVCAGWRHARACCPRPSPSPLGRATPYARARHPRPPTLPHLRGRGSTRGHAAPGPPFSLGPRHPVRAGWRHARARGPLSPSLPAPPPLGHAARTRGNGAPERTCHPSCGRGVHKGTTPPAAPYARARHTRAHPSPFAPRFPLVRATPFARKGGMRGQAAPSHGALFAWEGAHGAKLCHTAGPVRSPCARAHRARTPFSR
ncbi:hypothetical protein EDB85DRAFT_2056572, partial [Lactarius pseudohatsudake]